MHNYSEEAQRCVVVSSVQANSDGFVEISFFVITDDRRGLLSVNAIMDAMEVSCTSLCTCTHTTIGKLNQDAPFTVYFHNTAVNYTNFTCLIQLA